jgi:hypothetical protein
VVNGSAPAIALRHRPYHIQGWHNLTESPGRNRSRNKRGKRSNLANLGGCAKAHVV